MTDPGAFYAGEFADALLDSVADGGALSQEDLDAYRVVETAPRSVPVDRLHRARPRRRPRRRLLQTMATAARPMPGDPRTDPTSARGLVAALRAPDKRAETTNIVAVDRPGRRLRDHHQPGARVRASGWTATGSTSTP